MNNILYVPKDEWPSSDQDADKKIAALFHKGMQGLQTYNQKYSYCGIPTEWEYWILTSDLWTHHRPGHILGIPYKFRRDLKFCMKMMGSLQRYAFSIEIAPGHVIHRTIPHRTTVTIKVK